MFVFNKLVIMLFVINKFINCWIFFRCLVGFWVVNVKNKVVVFVFWLLVKVIVCLNFVKEMVVLKMFVFFFDECGMVILGVMMI